MMRALVGGMIAIVGCAAVEPTSEPPAEPAEQSEARGLPDELAAIVPAWQRVEPEWLAQATIWAVGTYAASTYPCVPGPDGSLDMILRFGFTPTKVLRGTLAAAAVDVDVGALRGASYPSSLADGRSYLWLLRPTPEMAARLADPKGVQAMHERLGGDQVVAVIDLSQSADEHASSLVTASRRGAGFDPEIWARARSAAVITGEQHAPVARFLAGELRPGATVAEVRAWVGAPDVEERVGNGLLYRYWLAQPRYAAPVDGGVYGQLELRFVDERLRSGAVRYFRWQVRPMVSSSSEIVSDELKPLGLANHEL
jgi:hypothetical protein